MRALDSLKYVTMSAREVDVELDAKLFELVEELIKTRPDLGYRQVEDFVNTAVAQYLKKHSKQA